MFRFFLKNGLHKRFRRRASSRPPAEDRWQHDPLSHPEIRNMSPAQLADLPFEPWRICQDN